MSKSIPKSEPGTQDEAPSDVTLTEFCQRLSQTDRRVELIAGFYSVEVKAGHIKDAESSFLARFQAFVNKPV